MTDFGRRRDFKLSIAETWQALFMPGLRFLRASAACAAGAGRTYRNDVEQGALKLEAAQKIRGLPYR